MLVQTILLFLLMQSQHKFYPLKILAVIIYLFPFLFITATSAQSVAGEWYGVGKVKKAGDHNSYLSEMVLKQKGNNVTGEFNYFYRSEEIKTKVTGKYNSKYKVLELYARPILNYMAKNSNGADCPMEGSFTLTITKSKTTLTGQFNPTYDYRITCPPIDINFVKSDSKSPKVTAPTTDTADEDTVATPVIKKSVPITSKNDAPKTVDKRAVTNKPDTTHKPAINNKPVVSNKTDTIHTPAITNKPVVSNKTDTIHTPTITNKTALSNKLDTIHPIVVIKKTDTIPKPIVIVKPPTAEQQVAIALKTRAFDVSPIIEVEADSLKVSLYDNGEVDNDSISLFYNRKLVAIKQMLSDKPLTFTLPLDSGVNEISMFAENLGKIPPNTALAIIYAGEERFELPLTSTFNKNATIRFRKKAKRTDPKNIN